MSRWQEMDEGRRSTVIGVYRTLWVFGILLAILGIAVALVGLLLALVASFWWALWIGLGMFALGLLTWFIGSLGAFGIAATEGEEAAERFLRDRNG